MKNKKILKKPIGIFWSLVMVFVLIMSYFLIPFSHEIRRALFPVIAVLALVFSVLGLMLIFYTKKLKIKGKLRTYFVLVGVSPIGSFISVIFHNFAYGLGIVLFGTDFWERLGFGDEPLFFILALLVFPLLFLIGMVGSIIILFRKRK